MKLKGFMVLDLFLKVEKNKKSDLEDLRTAARGDFGVSGATHTATAPLPVQTHTSDSRLMPAQTTPTSETVNDLSAPTYNYVAGSFGYSPFTYGDFSYKDQALLEAARDKATNFSYDPSQDNAYQTYAREYMRNGADAYRNSMARLASRTGGVGSSYAVQAAQGAYNDYMQQLADKVPELRELAYQKAKDAYDVYQNDYDRAYNMYNNERNFAYDQYQDARDIAYKNFQLQEAAREAAYKQNYNRQLDAYNSAVDAINSKNKAILDAENAKNKAISDAENAKSEKHKEDYNQVVKTAQSKKTPEEQLDYLTWQYDNKLINEDEFNYIYHTVLGLKTPEDDPMAVSNPGIWNHPFGYGVKGKGGGVR